MHLGEDALNYLENIALEKNLIHLLAHCLHLKEWLGTVIITRRIIVLFVKNRN